MARWNPPRRGYRYDRYAEAAREKAFSAQLHAKHPDGRCGAAILDLTTAYEYMGEAHRLGLPGNAYNALRREIYQRQQAFAQRCLVNDRILSGRRR